MRTALLACSLLALGGCDHRRAGPWGSADAGALVRLAEVWCGTQDTCLEYVSPCCWETGADPTPEREALLEQCLEDVVRSGCDVRRTSVDDGGTLVVEPISESCREAEPVIGTPDLAGSWGPYRCSSDWYLAGAACTCRGDGLEHAASGWGTSCASATAEASRLAEESCATFGGVGSCRVEACARRYSAGGALDGGQ